MLRDRKTQQQNEYEIVLLEELVSQDHFLRKVDAAVDFSLSMTCVKICIARIMDGLQ